MNKETLENVADVNSYVFLGVELDRRDRKHSGGVTESPPSNGSCLVYEEMV